jgi:hypothetical protein
MATGYGDNVKNLWSRTNDDNIKAAGNERQVMLLYLVSIDVEQCMKCSRCSLECGRQWDI